MTGVIGGLRRALLVGIARRRERAATLGFTSPPASRHRSDVAPNGRKDVSGRFRAARASTSSAASSLPRDRRESQRGRRASLSSKLARSIRDRPPNRPRCRDARRALANAASRSRDCACCSSISTVQAVTTRWATVGDVLLKQVGQRLAGAIGAAGQIGRLGGDEFEAVLPGEEEEGRLAALAEHLIKQVSKPYLIRGHSISIGASVGIAVARPGRTYAEQLIRDADVALYAAKAAGRGTFRLFEPEMQSQASDRQILQKDLEHAVAKSQMRLLFQPIVEAGSEDLAGFEALLRWSHPVRGPLAPAEFLTVAEESGLIDGIGEWVLRTALAEAAGWPRHLRLAVNISPSQLRNPRTAAIVANALAARAWSRTGSSSSSARRRSWPTASIRRDGKRAQGSRRPPRARRFGTGASSLASIRATPLDRIKIDQSFLRSALSARSRNGAVLGALVTLANSLDMDVTAEGAETLEDLTLARRLGVGHIQGFLFGRPMPAPEARALAAKAAAVPAKEAEHGRPPATA